MSQTGKRFDEEVSKVVSTGNIYKGDLLVFNKVMDVIVTNIDVLDSGVAFCIFGECDSTIVVCMDGSRLRLREAYIHKRCKHLLDLLHRAWPPQ